MRRHLQLALPRLGLATSVADVMAPLTTRVLLTTLPGEPHGLGLPMAEAMCVLEGALLSPLASAPPPSP